MKIDIEKLERLDREASSKTWEMDIKNCGCCASISSQSDDIFKLPDAKLIVESRNMLPDIIKELKASRKLMEAFDDLMKSDLSNAWQPDLDAAIKARKELEGE